MEDSVPPSPIAILEEYIQRPNYDRSESSTNLASDRRSTVTSASYRPLMQNKSQTSLRAGSIIFKDLEAPETTTAVTLSNVITADGFGDLRSDFENRNRRSESPTPQLKVFHGAESDRQDEGMDTRDTLISNGVRGSVSATDEEDVSKLLGHLLNDRTNSINKSVTASIFSGITGFMHNSDDSTNTYNGEMNENVPIDYGFKIERADEDSDDTKFFQNKKHFFILSSAGKPIYSMHGSDDILTVYSGVIQTIISFFQFGENGETELLKSYVAGNIKFLFLNQSPIILMATSTLNESDIELNQQLEFLYNFFLTTLSKPHIEKVFRNRENFDLRKLLGRADIVCLDSICNSLANFNNPGLIIGGLECLKLSSSIRSNIEQIMLSKKSNDLLYGMLVAPGARLITVLRPRKHTLHTSDLQQLFSMIFNTNTFKTSSSSSDSTGEETFSDSNEEFWVPICLPKFNPNGFLYSFIQFFDLRNSDKMAEFGLNQDILSQKLTDPNSSKIAIILISAYKDSFFPIRDIGSSIIKEITSSRKIYRELFKSIVGTQGSDGTTGRASGRISPVDIPAPLIKHFIFKSNKHTQYLFSRLQGGTKDDVEDEIIRGQLMMIYSYLHSKKITNTLNDRFSIVPNDEIRDSNKFMSYVRWKVNNGKDTVVGILVSTPAYEVYAINNGGIVDKDTLVKSCKSIIKWCRKNEDKLFVSGGAVF